MARYDSASRAGISTFMPEAPEPQGSDAIPGAHAAADLRGPGGPPARDARQRDGDLPRERLARLGPEALSDAELLALLLRTGGPGVDCLEVARGLVRRCGGLRGAARAPVRVLGSAPGIGPAKAASLRAAFEIGRRVAAQRLCVGDPIRSPDDVHRHFHARLRDAERECFITLLLDGRQRMIGEVLVSQGTLTASLVHPREVFRAAVQEAAAAVILVHNHPSGDPSPSGEDHEVTRRLTRAGEIMGIRVLDHVVVAERGYHSFQQSGDMSPTGKMDEEKASERATIDSEPSKTGSNCRPDRRNVAEYTRSLRSGAKAGL